MNQDSKTPIDAFKAWAPMGKFKGVEYKKQGKGPDASYNFKCVYLCRYQSNGHYTCKMQVLHKLGSDTVELQWFREGTGHMQSHDRFLTHAEHKAFQHVRVKKGTNLPFAVEECIQAYLAANPTKSATDARNHLKNEHGSTFDFTPEQWSAIWSKIVTHGRHVLTKITAEYAPMSMTNQLRDIQEFAEANTWERRVEELGSDFTEHTPFVAGIEIVPINPPADKAEHERWMKQGSPRHIVRVAITNIVMSMFVPAIASRADLVNGRITISSDMTFKLFLGKYELIDMFCHDGCLNAKLMGFLITSRNKASDYYFIARACRNITEYVCALKTLPGSAKLPFRLPSPVPPCSPEFPMQYNKSTGRFEGNPSATKIRTIQNPRHLSSKSKEARAGVDNDKAEYFPSLVEAPVDGVAESFRLDTHGNTYVGLSDGDIAIKHGVGAAIPSVANTHVSCWAHQYRTNDDVIGMKKKKYIDSGKVPIFDIAAKDEEERTKQIKKQSNSFHGAVEQMLLDVKYCTSRPLSMLIFDDFLAVLRDNRLTSKDGEKLSGNFSGYANYLSSSFGRTNPKGCNGVWRYTDLLDTGYTAMDEDGKLTSVDVVPLTDIVYGVPDNTNSVEAQHRWFKERLDNERVPVPQQLNNIMTEAENYSKDEEASAGVSVMQVPYGSHRIKTSLYAWDRDIGMLFLGNPSKIYDARVVRQYDRLKYFSTGLNTKIYMLRGTDELERRSRSQDRGY